MARHEQPDKLEKPLCTYICNCDHFPFAIKSAKLLENFKENLKVWWTQYPSSREYTCWYIGFNYKEQPFILNINIRPSCLELEFRYPRFIPKEFKLAPSQIRTGDVQTRGAIQRFNYKT
jgi:hypothetical protein